MVISDRLELEIGQHASEYLNGRVPLHVFEDWFTDVIWDLAEREDCSVRRLAGRIANVIAEYSRGDRTIESMRREMENAIRPFEVAPPSFRSALHLIAMDKPRDIELFMDGAIPRFPVVRAAIGSFDQMELHG